MLNYYYRTILALWGRLLRAGCHDAIVGLTRSRVLMLNGVLVLTSLMVVGFWIVYWIYEYPFFYGCLWFIPLTFAVMLLNRANALYCARWLYYFSSLAFILFWCYQIPGRGGEYALVGLCVTSILIFQSKSFIYVGGLVCGVAFCLYKYWESTLDGKLINTNVLGGFEPFAILGATLAIIAYQMMFFRDLSFFYEKKLSLKYEHVALLLVQKGKVEAELRMLNQRLIEANSLLETTVLQTNAELQTYIDAMNINIFSSVTDVGGNFTRVNDQVVKVSGYSREELVGSHYSILSSGTHSEEFFLERRNMLAAGKTWRGEVEHKTKDGSMLWLDCVVMPIPGPQGSIQSFLTVGLAITERKLNEQLREHTHKLLETIAFRASHKVRGPLARIRGLAELVLQNMVSEDEFEDIAEKMADSCEEVNQATSELVRFVYQHQQLVK